MEEKHHEAGWLLTSQFLLDGDPAARLVGDEPQRRQGLVTGGLGLYAQRLPGQLWAEHYITTESSTSA